MRFLSAVQRWSTGGRATPRLPLMAARSTPAHVVLSRPSARIRTDVPGSKAPLDVLLDILESNSRLVIHPLELVMRRFRRSIRIGELSRIPCPPCLVGKAVADDDRPHEGGVRFARPAARPVALRDRPVQHDHAAPDLPLLAKGLAEVQRLIRPLDLVRGGEPFGPGVWIADIVEHRL